MIGRAGLGRLLAGLLLSLAWPAARGEETIATVLADFETDSVAATIGQVQNVLASDCTVERARLPARGQQSLKIEIGALNPNASVVCDLLFRVSTPIEQPRTVAAFCWIEEGEASLAFRVRDGEGRIFETPLTPIGAQRRWHRKTAELSRSGLTPVTGDGAPQPPLEIIGVRVTTPRIGRQVIFFDDLEVEHRVADEQIIRGEFSFDQPTQLYEPGATVRSAVVLENGSRSRRIDVSVELTWRREDGTQVAQSNSNINLPASGLEFRSRQAVNNEQRLDDPGLYRLEARVRSIRWTRPVVFRATVAVTPGNRNLSRGRSVFFGLRTNLLREPASDRQLEIRVARELGVQLLAIDAPWRSIEPRADRYDFRALDEVIDAIAGRGVAPLIAITDPPEWLATDGANLAERVRKLLEALARRYGVRVGYYQVFTTHAGDGELSDEQIAALAEQLRRVQPGVQLLYPPRPAAEAKAAAGGIPAPVAGALIVPIETQGESPRALRSLAELGDAAGFRWSGGHWWYHRAAPRGGTGGIADAIAVLEHYVRAAEAGVDSLVWFDLRDDSSDPRQVSQMRGLVARDFGPKAWLLGYASTVGMLSGTRYGGRVAGTPDEFDSALFMASDRQVAVLIPRPNRIRPAVLAPISGVPGLIAARDFARREVPLLAAHGPPLLATRPDPLFVTIGFERIQADPQLELARPWVRVPAQVFVGDSGGFAFEVEAPLALRRSYFQVGLPDDAAFESSVSSRRIQAAADEAIAHEVVLSRREGRDFQRASITLKLSLEGRSLEIPLDVRPLRKLARGGLDARRLPAPLGTLAAASNTQRDPGLAAYGSYEGGRLHLAVALPDDVNDGDRVRVGAAAENADSHVEFELSGLNGQPALRDLLGIGPADADRARCSVAATPDGRKVCILSIDAAVLGAASLKEGQRVLFAMRLDRLDGRDGTVRSYALGEGLEGQRRSEGFQWGRLE